MENALDVSRPPTESDLVELGKRLQDFFSDKQIDANTKCRHFHQARVDADGCPLCYKYASLPESVVVVANPAYSFDRGLQYYACSGCQSVMCMGCRADVVYSLAVAVGIMDRE